MKLSASPAPWLSTWTIRLPLLLVRQNLPVGVKSVRSGGGGGGSIVLVEVVVVVVGMLVVVDVVVSVMMTVPGPEGGFVLLLQPSESAASRTPVVTSHVRIRKSLSYLVRSMPTTGVNRACRPLSWSETSAFSESTILALRFSLRPGTRFSFRMADLDVGNTAVIALPRPLWRRRP
jgi:hypothetical protein